MAKMIRQVVVGKQTAGRRSTGDWRLISATHQENCGRRMAAKALGEELTRLRPCDAAGDSHLRDMRTREIAQTGIGDGYRNI
jgi:hypothetical protein